MILSSCAGGEKGVKKKDENPFAQMRSELLDGAAINLLVAKRLRHSESQGSKVPLGIYKSLIPGEFSLEKAPDSRFDLLVKDVDAAAFFKSLSRDDHSVSMVVHPQVAGKISLELKQVTIDEVVDVACEMYHFECRMFGDGLDGWRGYKIFPWQLVTRTYRVDFLPISRDGWSSTAINSITSESDQSSATSSSNIKTRYDADFWGDLEDTLRSILNLDLVTTSIKDTVNREGLEKREIEKKPFDSQYDTVVSVEDEDRSKQENNRTAKSKSDGSSNVKSFVEGTPADDRRELDDQDGGLRDKIGDRRIRRQLKNLMVNRQSGLITVRAYPKDHTDIKDFLEHLRSRSQRQVILEAKILEVTLTDGSQLGVDWVAVNKGLGSSSSPSLSSEQNSATTFAHSITSPVYDAAGDNLINNVTTFGKGLILSKGAATTPFSLAIRSHDFIGFVSLLKRQGKVKVLSSPRIATLNNQKAVIKVGQDEVFIIGMKPGTSVSNASNVSTVSLSVPVFEKMFTGISLDVTPQIGDSGEITLHVHPLITDVSDKVKTFNINDQVQSIPLALSQTRETDSIVRISNGEVAVIGGLIKKNITESEDRVPLLGDIPGIGSLFKQVVKSSETSELVILIRPVIVGGTNKWSSGMVRTARRLQNMGTSSPKF